LLFYTAIGEFSHGNILIGEFLAGVGSALILIFIVFFIADFKIINESFSSGERRDAG